MHPGEHPTIITLASMKGGVGKTTLSILLACYLAETQAQPVLVIDLDPQRGATLLLLGPHRAIQYEGFTILDVLLASQANLPALDVLAQAMCPSPFQSQISLVPSCAGLGRLAGPHTRRDLLKHALADPSRLPASLILIDSGPDISLCELSLAAADLVFIPLTLSQQSALPTLNTLQAALRQGAFIAGLIPTMVGRAGWNQDRIEHWRHNLEHSPLLRERGIPLLPNMPYSPTAVRGTWRWGTLPPPFLPLLEDLSERILAYHPVPLPVRGG
jgi:cellulose biosynthesis protein BcsQ